MDKQIIIDGVDVSGCEWFKKWNSGCSLFDGSCGGHSKCESELSFNCYYKQLKRKEQECERLDNEAQNLFTEKTNLEIELNQLKAENEELKNFHINLVGVKECEIKELLKLKQALKEIKEIAEKQIPCLDIDKAKSLTELEYDYAGKIYDLEQRMYKILQKIREVEDERI